MVSVGFCNSNKEAKRLISENGARVNDKIITKSEEKNIHIIRKVIVAKNNIKKGELFSNENLIIKRAGKGMSSINLWRLFGKPANRNFKKNEIIKGWKVISMKNWKKTIS